MVKLSTAFHSQTDGQVERTIQTLKNMVKACIIDFKGIFDKHLPMVDFAYNNSFNLSISMAPYEAFYGRRCRYPMGWFEVNEPLILGPDMIYRTLENMNTIRNRCWTDYSRQKSYNDNRRRDLEF